MNFQAMIIKTIIDPATIVRHMNSLNLKPSELLQALFFVSISSVILTYLTFWLPNIIFGEKATDLTLILSIVNNNPFVFVFLQSAIILFISILVAFGGQFFKGLGTFDCALAGVLWINFILLIINLVQIILIISIPILADILALMASFWSLWALVIFSKELHGFNSIAVTGFVGLLLFTVSISILGIILAFFGFVAIEGV